MNAFLLFYDHIWTRCLLGFPPYGVTQLLERDPGSLPSHFGTAAAREALQPLTAWAARHGLLSGGPLGGGLHLDTSGLGRLAAAALQGGHDLLEVRRHTCRDLGLSASQCTS